MFKLSFRTAGLTEFSNVQIAVVSRVYNRQQAKRAARWLSQSIGRTVTIVPAVYGPFLADGSFVTAYADSAANA